MFAIEFEAELKSEFIRVPHFEKLKNRHVKVIVLSDSVNETYEIHSQRRPAKVPPIAFCGDVINTATTSDWDLT
ncbi:hypothetical protein [Chrysiogenes arsenatis]|uniref:hypothetical protein n=1 Tax=Chrysiogenes arsenatis TaxID=309797 RepID=UPI00042886AF|nr:hypothetical protein [Chrysiogenes arsenatis]